MTATPTTVGAPKTVRMRTQLALLRQQQVGHSLQSTDRQVYPGIPLRDLIPDLCATNRVVDIAANLVYQCLDVFEGGSGYDRMGLMFRVHGFSYLQRPDEKKLEQLYSDLYQTCSLLLEPHCIKPGAENLFAVLSPDILDRAAPFLRKVRRDKIRDMLLHGMSRYMLLNREAMQSLDWDKVWTIVGTRHFLELVERFQVDLNEQRIRRATSSRNSTLMPGGPLRVETVDAMLHVLLNRKPMSVFQAISLSFAVREEHDGFAESAGPPTSKNLLCQPLLPGSAHSLGSLLERVLHQKSEHLLRKFFYHLVNDTGDESLFHEAVQACILDRCPITGFARSTWAAEVVERIGKESRPRRLGLLDHDARNDTSLAGTFSLAPSIFEGAKETFLEGEEDDACGHFGFEEEQDIFQRQGTLVHHEHSCMPQMIDVSSTRTPGVKHGKTATSTSRMQQEVKKLLDEDSVINDITTELRLLDGADGPRIAYRARSRTVPMSALLDRGEEDDVEVDRGIGTMMAEADRGMEEPVHVPWVNKSGSILSSMMEDLDIEEDRKTKNQRAHPEQHASFFPRELRDEQIFFVESAAQLSAMRKVLLEDLTSRSPGVSKYSTSRARSRSTFPRSRLRDKLRCGYICAYDHK
ncbi:unnamed protein product [Amoebophrya sp. A25]|nr:unnamed protein product [Amoebophrya sp. A25]|eukprot:GSA25T00013024001.1